MKIITKHGYYEQSQYYRNLTSSSLMLDDRQQTRGLIATPAETSMTRLPQDNKDYGPTGPDTSDTWNSSDDDTDKEADDSSCIMISHEALSLANEAGTYDEESGLELDGKPGEKMYSSAGKPSSQRVRFSDAPPDVCRYERPDIECFNELYYTGHEMQEMQLEFLIEQAEKMAECPEGCEDLWSDDEDSD